MNPTFFQWDFRTPEFIRAAQQTQQFRKRYEAKKEQIVDAEFEEIKDEVKKEEEKHEAL